MKSRRESALFAVALAAVLAVTAGSVKAATAAGPAHCPAPPPVIR